MAMKKKKSHGDGGRDREVAEKQLQGSIVVAGINSLFASFLVQQNSLSFYERTGTTLVHTY